MNDDIVGLCATTSTHPLRPVGEYLHALILAPPDIRALRVCNASTVDAETARSGCRDSCEELPCERIAFARGEDARDRRQLGNRLRQQ
jgi:hypothetical protein